MLTWDEFFKLKSENNGSTIDDVDPLPSHSINKHWKCRKCGHKFITLFGNGKHPCPMCGDFGRTNQPQSQPKPKQ